MQLNSPGVSISVTDEGFYSSAAPGTVPLVVIATASNKLSPSGAGIAPFTANQHAGKLYAATSQRELIQVYGNPTFYSSGGTSLHGYELNEYGLHALYQFLGVSDLAYVLRADIDLNQLIPSDTAPSGAPNSGTYWLDTYNTVFGVFKSNGKAVAGEAWVNQPVTVYGQGQTSIVSGTTTPLSNLGNNGDFGVVVSTNENFLFEKIAGTWYKVGSSEWKAAAPTIVTGTASNPSVQLGSSITINSEVVTFTSTTLSGVISAINNATINGIVASNVNNALRITNTTGESIILDNGTGTPLATLGMIVGTTDGNDLYYSNSISYPSGSDAGDVWIKASPTNKGAKWSIKVYNGLTSSWQSIDATFYPFNSSLADGAANKDTAAINAFGDSIATGVIYIGYHEETGITQIRRYNGANFEPLIYEAGSTAPASDPVEGTLWLSNDYKVDIMVSNGSNWRGYKNVYPDTNPDGVFIAGSKPVTQSDGTALVNNDLWIDSSDLENYPALYRFDATLQRWRAVDLTDQTSPLGIISADARENSGTAFSGQVVTGYSYNSERIEDLLVSDYIDPDAPDPRTVPAGTLLLNTRFSTNNVKSWTPEYFGYDGYDNNTDYSLVNFTVGNPQYTFAPLASKGRWVTVSGNKNNGYPLMGRKAQRSVIVKAMAKALNESDSARSEIVSFDLIAAPGYPELIDEMVSLNTDQGMTSFVVADSPARLSPLSDSIDAWANNRYGASTNGEDGLLTSDPYTGVFYPWGMSTNIDGSDIMVPPSTMVLRTISMSDAASHPWFAPAGFRRGLINNATTVGYLDSEDEFRPVMLSPGQRDMLYINRINPIALMPSRGLVLYGQKTRAVVNTSMDRINVARLVNYLRRNLDIIVKPFIMEPNDKQTRDAVKLTVDRFLSGIVGLRGLEDYAIQVDESNNTAERVARKELWCDLAIKPVDAVEFIYVPMRLTQNNDL